MSIAQVLQWTNNSNTIQYNYETESNIMVNVIMDVIIKLQQLHKQ